jgi:hypothetical protein
MTQVRSPLAGYIRRYGSPRRRASPTLRSRWRGPSPTASPASDRLGTGVVAAQLVAVGLRRRRQDPLPRTRTVTSGGPTMPDLGSRGADQRFALRSASTTLRRSSTDPSAPRRVELFSPPATTSSPPRPRWPRSCAPGKRFARQRLRAWPRWRARPATGDTVVLLLCTHNAGSLADGPTAGSTTWRRGRLSGGSEPGVEVNRPPRGMAEVGHRHTGEYPKPWTDEIVRADVWSRWAAATPARSSGQAATRTGKLEDPAGWASRPSPIRDEIGERVRVLLASSRVTARPDDQPRGPAGRVHPPDTCAPVGPTTFRQVQRRSLLSGPPSRARLLPSPRS